MRVPVRTFQDRNVSNILVVCGKGREVSNSRGVGLGC